MLMHDYGKEEGGWTYDDISKYFFIKWNSFETKKKQLLVVYLCHTNRFYLFLWFSTRSLPVVLLKLAMFFISGVSLIYINVNNC